MFRSLFFFFLCFWLLKIDFLTPLLPFCPVVRTDRIYSLVKLFLFKGWMQLGIGRLRFITRFHFCVQFSNELVCMLAFANKKIISFHSLHWFDIPLIFFENKLVSKCNYLSTNFNWTWSHIFSFILINFGF